MNRFHASLGAFLLLCSVAVLQGQSTHASPAASGPQIATLNFNAAVLGTAEAKRRLSALEQKYSPRQRQLQRSNDEAETLRKSLSESGDHITQAERNRKLEELSGKEKQLQREAEDFKNDSQSESQQIFQQIAEKVFAFLQTFSQQHEYTAVLERGTEAAPIVWYAASNVDITDQVTRGYDAKYPGGVSGVPEAPTANQSPEKSHANMP